MTPIRKSAGEPDVPGSGPERATEAVEPSLAAPEKTQLSATNGVSREVSSVAFAEQRIVTTSRESSAAGALAYASGTEGADELSDRQLMLQVQAGDDNAFNALVEKFRRPMVGFMYRMARNQAVAEELAQEVFLRVYRSRQSYAAEAKFSTWLYRIATNLGLNHVRDTRSERTQTSVSLDEPDEETGRTLDVADSHLSAEQEILRRERLAAIRKHVEALPERQRTAVILHKYQDMDYREIGKVLKMSESATKSLLFRAYEALRERLKGFV